MPMSMGIDNTQTQRKNYQKPKDLEIEKSEKKRKRFTSDSVVAPAAKKHKTAQRPKSPTTEPSTSGASPFYQQTTSLFLPIPPISQAHALLGLCAEYLSPLILTYYPPFHGIIVSYTNARLSTKSQPKTPERAYARAIDEYAASFIWLTADFLIFRPQKGDAIEGYVNLQNQSNIGLLCCNFFNASIERKRLSKEWRWIPGGSKSRTRTKLKKAAKSTDADSRDHGDSEGDAEVTGMDDSEGYFQDSQGDKVGGLIRFRIKAVETSRSMDRENGFLSIEGTMLSEEEERILLDEEGSMLASKEGKAVKPNGRPRAGIAAALPNGYDDDDLDVQRIPATNHRAEY